MACDAVVRRVASSLGFEYLRLGLSQLFENNFGNNRCLLEYEKYSSLIGLETSQRSAVDDVDPSVDAQDR